MDRWVQDAAAAIAARAPLELEALVGVSSPSGDERGAEEVLAIVSALLPDGAVVERPPCSSPRHAPDFVARLAGGGRRRLLLLGHVDTVVAHGDHRPLRADGDRLWGPGTVDMKGGDVIALGVLRALATVPETYAEVALLLVCDEEWRTVPFAHAERFAGFDACLCFEAGQVGADGVEEVVVRRKAAGTLRVTGHGRSAHSGSSPEAGANALLALVEVARLVAAHHDPGGPDRLTVVPTLMRAGEALNVVPGGGALTFDLRADDRRAFAPVTAAVPAALDGVRLETEMLRVWPGMDGRAATAPALADAGRRLGRTVRAGARGGASDASHIAAAIPLTVDGLGPRGGGAHAPDEHVVASTLRPSAELALALARTLLDDG